MKLLDKFTYNEQIGEYISNKTYFGLSPSDDCKLYIGVDEDFTTIYYKSNRGRQDIIFDGGKKLNGEELETVFKLLNVKI